VTDRAFGSGWRMPVACKEAERKRVLLHETSDGRVL
jgi:hypothetical protein